MNVGERIKFPFGGGEKEGVVLQIFPKKVYLKVDFPNHPGKIVIRSIAELEGKNNAQKSKRREKAEKEKKAKREKKEAQSNQKKDEEEKEA